MASYLSKSLKSIMTLALFSLLSTAVFASVDYSVSSDWGSAFQGQFTITNTSTAPLEKVSLEFDFPYTINSMWDASVASRAGNHYTVNLPSWKTSIAPGEKYSFGFIAQPGNASVKPSNIKLNGTTLTTPSANTNPTANDDAVTTNVNTAALINPLANDSDADGDTIFLAAISQPVHGSAVQSGNSVTYTPSKDYIGTDSFKYTIGDDKGGTASATINITIQNSSTPSSTYGAWDAVKAYIAGDRISYNGHNYEAKWWTQGENPSTSGQWGVWKDLGSAADTTKVAANNDTATVDQDKSVIIDVLKNDQGTGLVISKVSTPSHGTAAIESSKITYTPAKGYYGSDTFTYTIKDSKAQEATASVQVTIIKTVVDPIIPPVVTSDKINATYWSLWGGNTSYNIGGKQIVSNAVDLDKIDSSYNMLIVAFIITDANGNLYLAYDMNNPANQQGLYNPEQVKKFITNAKAQGKKVIVSLGGEKFHLSLKTEAQKQLFITQAKNIINEYGFDGLDLDLEAGSFTSDPALLGQAVSQIVNDYRSSGKTFALTAAPEWCYIVPFAYGTGQWATHSLAGEFYISLIKTIGVDKFTYIWPQTYNQGPSNGVTGKDNLKVSPADGMDKFLAAMTWAATTAEGFTANGSIGLQIPPSKFALGIPATEGAAGGEMAYIATPALISSAVSLIKSQGAGFAGFMNWSVDWDALNITNGQLTAGYTHTPWETGRAAASALNIIAKPTPTDTTVSFASHTDGQIIKIASLSPIDILLSVIGDSANIASTTITVDGKIYEGASASWTPNAFGAHTITATVKEKDGTTIIVSINVVVEKTTVVPPIPSASKKQVIGYITQWDAWKGDAYQLPAKGVFNQLNVDYSKYTIINYSFFGVAKDGSLHSADFRNKAMTATNQSAEQEPAAILNEDIYSSWDMWLLYGDVQFNWNTSPAKVEKVIGGAPGLFDLCKQNNVKLMASIGGWSMSKHFSDMANSATKKALFLRDVKKLMDMGFDGIDIDWEYPGAAGMNFTGKEYDYANYVILMKDIRATIGGDKLLTGAFSASPANLNNFNWVQLSAYMDYFNIMSYDLEGGWSDTAGHNSALYGNSSALCWDNTFKFLTQTKGVKADKINMGVASYGRGVETLSGAALGGKTKKSVKSFSVDGSLDSAADFANWGLFEGVPNYAYIINNQTGWFYHWDEAGKVPYMTKDNYFLSFDNPQSVGLKADYVNNNNAGGVIIWQVFGDMQFTGGVSYVNPSIKKLPKADKVTTPLLDVLHDKLNK